MNESPDLIKQLEDLRKQEELYHTLLSTIPDLIVITDLNGVVQYVNDAGVRLSGFANSEEIIGHNIMEFVIESQRAVVIERLQQPTAFTNIPIEFYLQSSPEMDPIPFEILRNTLYDENSLPTGLVYVCRDIRQRKFDAGEIKRNSALLKGVSDAVNTLLIERSFDKSMNKTLSILGECTKADRVYIFRNHTDVFDGNLLFSQAYEWTSGLVTVELNNPDLQNVRYNLFPPDFYEALSGDHIVKGCVNEMTGVLQQILISQSVLSLLIVPVMVHDDFWGFVGFDDCHQERVWSEGDISVLRAAAAGIGGAIHRENTHRELEVAYLKAEESDRLKSSLLANMSHEFRTPMTGILGFAEMICHESESDDLKQMGSHILTSAKRLMNTLDAMIKLSEIESGLSKSDMSREKIEVNAMILSCVSDSIQKAKRKNLPIEFKKTDPVYAVVDQSYTKQIINHLLDNAIKFTHEGMISLQLLIRQGVEGDWLVVEVSDTGMGIPPEYHHTIFTEFRQVSEGIGRHHEGSGLGLTIANKITTLLGGHIEIDSQTGKGSTFRICLPYEPWSPSENPGQMQRTASSQAYSDLLTQRNNSLPDVLLVEDNDVNVQLVVAYLRGICKTDFAMYGLKAIQMAKLKTYRLILMDINLGPGIDGLETAREIRKIPGYEKTPIVAVTGFTLLGERDRLLEGGCTHYIPKPFDQSTLIDLCKQILNE